MTIDWNRMVMLLGCLCLILASGQPSWADDPPSESTEQVDQEQAADEVSSELPDEEEAESSQEDEEEPSADNSDQEGSSSTSELRLPSTLPDGRPLLPILLYQSQMDELIPNTFMPVSIDRLEAAIERNSQASTDDQASRLKNAVYFVEVVGDSLVSAQSVIDIESDVAAVVRRSLGKVNLAIDPRNRGLVSALNELPRLETEADGNLVAVFQGDDVQKKIEFSWRLRGKTLGSGHDFVMRLPPTPQTRIVLSTPKDLDIEVLNGVLRRRSAPPPDVRVTRQDLRWFEIDAGGLESVRIKTKPKNKLENSNVDNTYATLRTDRFVVRMTTTEYSVEASGLRWTCQMLVEPPIDGQFPPFEVSNTILTGVRVNADDAEFTSKVVGGRVNRVQLASVDPATFTDSFVTLTLTGYSTWSDKNGWCGLPMPVWVGDHVALTASEDNVVLQVAQPLKVVSWELPEDWRQTSEQDSENSLTLKAKGPSIALPYEGDQKGGGWSRVRLANRGMATAADTMLRLGVKAASYVAKANLKLTVDPSQAEPIRIQVEPKWNIQSISFVGSGRVIDGPNIKDASRTLVLWPEAEDVAGSQIEIEVVGSRDRPPGLIGLSIPATWFVRIANLRGNLVAAIERPQNLNWSGEAALQPHRVKSAELSESEQEFFRELDSDTLYFRPEVGRTPMVSLQTPSVSYASRTQFEVLREENEVIETLIVEVDSTNQNLGQLVVQTGPAVDRPPLLWSLRTEDGDNDQPTISLPSSAVEVGTGEDEGIYSIDLTGQSLRGRQLIARRRYPVIPRREIRMPTVPNAASQNSEALIGPGLLVQEKPRSVQAVPDPDSADHLSGSIRLRYDAEEQPSIVLVESNQDPNLSIVWQEQVRVIASSRGTDRVVATFKVSPTLPIAIEYEPGLQLTSITRDNIPVDLATIQRRPSIILQPQAKTETIQVVWNRSQYNTTWVRRCRVPRISISGVVLNSEYLLEPAADAFAPAALLRGDVRSKQVAARPNDNATLIRRNVALAIGWLVAICIFAVSWFVAERSPLLTACAVLLLSTILVLWWPWKLAVIGWLLIPVVSAATLATARAWSDQGSRFSEENVDPRETPSVNLDDLSADFSMERVARLLSLLMMLASGWITANAIGQESSRQSIEDASRDQAATVLVPVDSEGVFSGSTVYIPESVHVELFRTTDLTKPQDARFQTASYRLIINPTITGQERIQLEAEYLIHVENGERSVNQVRLPLPANAVGPIELLGDVNRIRPKSVEGPDSVLVKLPSGSAFRLRVTLTPELKQSDAWTTMSLPIPRVASSRLTIETEQTIDAIRVGGASHGRLLEEVDLRRWEDDLGPVDELDVAFRAISVADTASTEPLRRRYWVNANRRQFTIDCEIDAPKGIAVGEVFQFVIRDDQMPSLISSDWKFDESELYSPTRRLVSVECARDQPGPIRLLWVEPLPPQDRLANASRINVPEVIAAALGDNEPAWIALSSDDAFDFAPLIANPQPLSVNHLWSGYRGRIDRAYTLDQVPQLLFRPRESSMPSIISESHELLVMPDQLQVKYSASLLPEDWTSNQLTLRVPRGISLIKVTVNGRPQTGELVRSKAQYDEINLDSLQGLDAAKIEVVGLQKIGSNRQFSPPAFNLHPLPPGPGTYQIFRTSSASMRVATEPSVQPKAVPSAVVDALARGRIPVAQWEYEPDRVERSSCLDGIYRVSVPAGPRSTAASFDCQQLIALVRQDRRWAMETRIRFRAGRIPDFIDVQVPTRWCDNLEVRPASAWTQQPATDPAFQIVRIRCDASLLRREPLLISAQLADSEAGRVSVPVVDVLGLGGRQIHISVPQTLEDNPIQWRTTARTANLPKIWSTIPDRDDRSTFLANNPSWSVDLAPLREFDAGASCLTCDSQVFAQSDGALVLSHWDILPGSMDAISVRLPEGAKCLGAWSAGHAVLAQVADQSLDDESTGAVRVPLSLSRLAQPVEMLIHVPALTAKRGRYLPELEGISVEKHWLTNYVPGTSVAKRTVENRALQLAGSIVDAVEADSKISERPREEVTAWLRLWVLRYQSIAKLVGHKTDFEVEIESLSDNAAERLKLPSNLQWRHLDSRLGEFVKRFLMDRDQNLSPPPDSFHFAVGQFEGYMIDHVTNLTAGNRPRAVQPISGNDLGLRNLMVNLLSVVLVCGVLICLKPLRGYAVPIVVHPAFWLGLLGLCSFAVAPAPVAAALVLVAVSLPVFPKKSRGVLYQSESQ